MTRRKNSARDQPLTQVDITPETLYNLNKLVEQNASLLALLENHKTGPQDALKSELKGVSDMNKRFRQRVRIGVDQAGKPIYKWATGYSVDELNDSIVRIYFENNMAGKFMDEAVAPKPTNCPTFQEYAEKWYQTYKAAALKHTTARSYTSALSLHLYPFFGKMKLNEITVELIQQFLNEKEYLAYSTVHSMLIVFNNIMASAFEDELIPTNPAASKRIKITSRGKTERTALTPEQVTDIIHQIDTKLKGDDERRMITLFLFTGMRRGEVLGLKWEDIDLQKKLIHVERNVTYAHNQPEIGSTKTNSGKRVIPMDDRLIEYLKPFGKSGFVLGGEAPISNMVFRRLDKSIKRQIDLHGATPHVFRHTYITTLAKAGIDLKTIQRISGHANITTTLNIYTHTREEEIQAAGAKVGKLIGS